MTMKAIPPPGTRNYRAARAWEEVINPSLAKLILFPVEDTEQKVETHRGWSCI